MISVIVPVDNRIEYLSPCIESIQNQTYQDIEMIFVCDGESAAKDILHDAQKSDARIRYIEIPKSGPGVARNVGISESSGEYIAFCDSDDILPFNALDRLMRKMVRSRADIVIADFIEQYDSGVSIHCTVSQGIDGFERFFAYISIWNRLYRRQFLSEHHIAFEAVSQGEDMLFLADVFLSKPKVAVLYEVVYQWQRHETDHHRTLTHSDSQAAFLEILGSWRQFIAKMSPHYNDKVLNFSRNACPYLLDRLGNIRDFGKREEAFCQFKELLKLMDWHKYPVRFKKLFRVHYDVMMAQNG